MNRARLLAVALLVLAGLATFGAGAAPPRFGWPARLLVLFGLPLAASITATLVLPREPRRMGTSAKVVGTARFHPILAGALLLDLGAIGVGHALGWVNFTHGDQALQARKLLAVPLALPFTIAAATLGTEWALRARLWETLARSGRSREAATLSIAIGAALTLPAFVPGFELADPAFVACAVASALLREAASLTLFKSGGLFVAGAYRGTLQAIEAFGLGDWYGFWFPIANFVTSEPRFYVLRVAGVAAALGLILVATRRRARSAPERLGL